MKCSFRILKKEFKLQIKPILKSKPHEVDYLTMSKKIELDIRSLIISMELRRRLLNTILMNDDLYKKESIFLDYLFESTFGDLVVKISRLCDGQDKGTQRRYSLVALMQDISKCTELFSRDRLAKKINYSDKSEEKLCLEYFNNFFDQLSSSKNRNLINKNKIHDDINLLNRKYEKIKSYRDEHYIHRSEAKINNEIEIEEKIIIEVLKEIISLGSKYLYLVSLDNILFDYSIESIVPHFENPWIKNKAAYEELLREEKLWDRGIVYGEKLDFVKGKLIWKKY